MTQDLFFQSQHQKQARNILTVSQITHDIKLILESTFGEAWVEGEVSNFQAHPSGHFYFTLKDDLSVLPAAMFARANREVKFKIENGQKVICFGKVSAYAPRGQYQIIVEKIEPKGAGSLQLALEQLKRKLEKEGLFSAEHKRQIPYLPSRIGVVTSISGAAIKDILKVLDRRFKDTNIIINPVLVQGEGAKEEIAKGIKDFNTLNDKLPQDEKIEVMIVGRGGGSTEDLWAFNEEIVARAIYSSAIPVISAVGHERDWTIADIVADLRAPTPSVAAELVIPKKEELQQRVDEISQDIKRSFSDISENLSEQIEEFSRRLVLSMQNALRLGASEFEAARKKLALLNPVFLIQQYKTQALDLARQIYVRTEHFLKLKEAQVTKAIEKLSGLSPLNILSRGYSITFKMPAGEIIKDAAALKSGDVIKTKIHKGEVLSKVMEAN